MILQVRSRQCHHYHRLCLLVAAAHFLEFLTFSFAYHVGNTPRQTTSPFHWGRRRMVLSSVGCLSLLPCLPSFADELTDIQSATFALQSLLDNWSNAVIDCTYADVPRELLEAKNKDQLLEKAKTNALFDKSVSVVSCKTNNRIVREYLGSTGPLVGLDKRLRLALDRLEDNDQEEYLQLIESVQQLLSKANSLSYAAGVSDLSAINNFDKDDESAVLAINNNLQETRTAIQEAVNGLNRVLQLVH